MKASQAMDNHSRNTFNQSRHQPQGQQHDHGYHGQEPQTQQLGTGTHYTQDMHYDSMNVEGHHNAPGDSQVQTNHFHESYKVPCKKNQALNEQLGNRATESNMFNNQKRKMQQNKHLYAPNHPANRGCPQTQTKKMTSSGYGQKTMKRAAKKKSKPIVPVLRSGFGLSTYQNDFS